MQLPPHLINVSIIQSSHISEQFLGAFLGALFAFCFFLLGEYIKDKVKWIKMVRKEHAYLERYFGSLHQVLLYNKGLLPMIIEDYKKHEINIMNFTPLPIREDSTMKMKDKIFINKMENYTTELKMLNLSFSNLNKWKEGINDDLLHVSEARRKRGAIILASFLKEAEKYGKVFDYHMDEIVEFRAENQVLLKKYSSWKYNKKKIEEEYVLRKEEIEKEKKIIQETKNNPIFNDHLDKLKKYGLYKDKV